MSENIIYLQEDNIYINGKYYNIDYIDNINNKIYIDKKINNIKELIEYLQKKYIELNIFNNYFILHNGKLINNTTLVNITLINTNIYNINKNKQLYNSFEIIEKQKGGNLIDVFESIIKIGELFLKLGDVVIWFVKFVIWFVKFLWWFLTDFLNPKNFFTDFSQSIMIIIISICRLPLDFIILSFALVVNTIGGWMQGFWGWDMSNLTITDKNSIYFQKYKKNKGQKTYITNTNTVPFSIILGTIICPPMGVFMDMGTSGWLNIIVCCLLTLLFYIPGLCYALLIIYA